MPCALGTAISQRAGSGPVPGISEIVSAQWPAPSDALSVAAIVLAVVSTAALVAELAWARRYAALLLGPPVSLLLLVLLLAPRSGPAPLPLLVLMTACSALVLRLASLATNDRQRDERDRAGFAALVVSVAALIALLPVAVGAPFGDSDRFDLRDRSDTAASIAEEISPLARLEEFRSRPREALFDVSPRVATDERWRFVALTRYDGQAWMPSDDFRSVGSTLGERPTRSSLLQYQVHIDSYLESWAPFTGRPIESSLDLRIDTTGSGLRLNDRLSRDDQYELALTQPTWTPEQLRITPVDEAVLSELPPVVEGLGADAETFRSLATEITQDTNNPYDRATRLANYLAEVGRFRHVESAPTGHRRAQLRTFLTNKQGRDEQFVATYALLARLVDLPARVSVGVVMTPTVGADGSTGWSTDVVAWPEIAFEDVGWVAFDPIPSTLAAEDAPAQQENTDGAARRVVPPPTTTAQDAQSTTSQVPVATARLRSLSVAARLGIAGVLLLLAALAYAISILMLKRNRRRRRQQVGRVDAQVTGAFLTGVERAVDLGAESSPSLTNRELVERSRDVVGGAVGSLEELAALATRAVFDDEPPSDRVAEAAWADSDRSARELQTSVGLVRWVRGRLSLRSLRGERLDEVESPLDADGDQPAAVDPSGDRVG
ncbi:MAG: transglutaminaseTgpA domain-containing protein [Ilumatobacteraceae bacterium]